MNVDGTRTAHKEDTTGICRIIGAVWPESAISIERIMGVLEDHSHSTIVFVIEDEVVGFVDGFMTISRDGLKRWELDLLAVQPDFQRKGIASALIGANTQAGQLMGAELARGLIAFDNVGSQRAFAKCGYETDGAVCELLIANEAARVSDATEIDNETIIIAVQTINYSGLWVEGKQSKAGLVKGLQRLTSRQYDLAGVVVPCNEAQVIEDAMSLGFEGVGRYQWWWRPF